MTAARLWSVLFLLASTGLGFLVAAELAPPTPAGTALAPRKAGKPADVEKIEPPRRRALQEFSAITRRPVFSETRRPEPPASDRSTARQTLDGVILMGTVIGRDRKSALLRLPSSPTLQTVSEGQEIAGWTLEKVLPDRVVLSSGGDSVEVSIWKDRPPPPDAEEPARQQKERQPSKPGKKRGG
jgi:type II secretory pathway component PulC